MCKRVCVFNTCFCQSGGHAARPNILYGGTADHNMNDSNWMQYVALNILVSAVISLCVIVLCLTCHNVLKTSANRGRKRNVVKWQPVAVKCGDDDEEEERSLQA
eukprot:75937_1